MSLKVNSIVEPGTPESFPIANFQFPIEALRVRISVRGDAHSTIGNRKSTIRQCPPSSATNFS
jgi:hypothetical protein